MKYIFKKDYYSDIYMKSFKKGDVCEISGFKVLYDGKWMFDLGSKTGEEYGYIDEDETIINMSIKKHELRQIKKAMLHYSQYLIKESHKKQYGSDKENEKAKSLIQEFTYLNKLIKKIDEEILC